MSARALPRGSAGLMLLEVMIALAIFSMMSVLGYATLRDVLDARARVEVQLDQLAKLQTAMWRIERDVVQAVAREIRDQHGDRRPALVGGPGVPEYLLEFSRGGWRNPGRRPRSELQRVAYRLRGRQIIRETWPVLDRAHDSSAPARVLLDDVERVELRFLDGRHEWRNDWPPAVEPGSPARRLLAIEWILELEGWGRVRQLFSVAPDGLL